MSDHQTLQHLKNSHPDSLDELFHHHYGFLTRAAFYITKGILGEFLDRETYNMGVVGLSHEYFINSGTYIKSMVSWSGTQLEDKFEISNILTQKRIWATANFPRPILEHRLR